MPGFIDIVSFPTSDGALHQVYANVHEETDAKLTLEFDRPFLRSLLLSLRSRREEKLRRIGRRPFDVTLGVFNHPAVDGDSMGLAFAITEHIASFVGANTQNADGSLALGGLPRIVATGDVDENGVVQSVVGMDAKLAGVLDAIESGAESRRGLFVFPASTRTPSVTRLIDILEGLGWHTLPVSHIDDVVPVYHAVPQKTRTSLWGQWKRPLKFGGRAAVAMCVTLLIFAFWYEPQKSVELLNDEPDQSAQSVSKSSAHASVPIECIDVSIDHLPGCLFKNSARGEGAEQ